MFMILIVKLHYLLKDRIYPLCYLEALLLIYIISNIENGLLLSEIPEKKALEKILIILNCCPSKDI